MFQEYCPGYLYGNLCSMAVAGVLLALLPGQRRLMLMSGLLSAPFALYSPIFVPEYWQPHRLAVLVTGLEDVAFSFANGVIVIALTAWALPPVPEAVRVSRPDMGRYLGIGAVCFLLILGFMTFNLGVMSATLLAGIVLWALLLASCRGRTWIASLVGGVGFGGTYYLLLRLILVFYPEMASWWSPQGLGGLWIWGVPLGELLWSVFYGATWPLVMGWTLGWHHSLVVPVHARGLR